MENKFPKRFYLDMTEAENDQLIRLAEKLTEKMGIRITKVGAGKLSIKAMAKKEGV